MTIHKKLLAHARVVLESRGLAAFSGRPPRSLAWRDEVGDLCTLALTRYSTRFGDVLRLNVDTNSVLVSKQSAKKLNLTVMRDGFARASSDRNRSEVTVLFSEGEAALDWVLSVPDGHTRPAPFALHRVHRSWGYVWSERAWEATEPPVAPASAPTPAGRRARLPA
jgi:hypothetical protein